MSQAETQLPTPVESVGTNDAPAWLADFGLDSNETNETELATDARPESGADPPPPIVTPENQDVTSLERAASSGPQPAAVGEAGPPDDSELQPEENELVREPPVEEPGEVVRKLKAATFEDHFKNPDKPSEEVRAYLEKKSASQYERLENSILEHRLNDPVTFALRLYEQAPEQYGDLALAIFNADREYFAQALSGRENVAPETVRTALDFYESYKDRIPENLPAANLTPEELAEIREYFPEMADRLEAQLKESPTSAVELAELRGQLKEFEQSQTALEQTRAAQARQVIAQEIDQTWDLSYETVASHVQKIADQQFGLAVTAKEREHAPLVAALKDLKRTVLFEGMGDSLPPFEAGLGEWGKSRPEFDQQLKAMYHFSQKRERDNAMEAARNLQTPAAKFLNERLKLPIFSLIDEAIRIVAKAKNPPAPASADSFTPGATGGLESQATNSNPDARLDDWLIKQALTN